MTIARNRRSNRISTAIRRARAANRARRDVRPSPATPIRVSIADDSYLIRQALAEVLAPIQEVDLISSSEDGEAFLAAVDANPTQVAIVDIRMPPGGDDEGIRVASKLRETHPEMGVVVLSQYSGPRYALALLEDGAEGRAYLLKERIHDRNELLAAINVVAQGGTMIDPTLIDELVAADRLRTDSPMEELTQREREVLSEMAEGKSNATIAETLCLTKRAVEKHVGAIFQKLGLEDDRIVARRVTAVLMYLSEAVA